MTINRNIEVCRVCSRFMFNDENGKMCCLKEPSWDDVTKSEEKWQKFPIPKNCLFIVETTILGQKRFRNK